MTNLCVSEKHNSRSIMRFGVVRQNFTVYLLLLPAVLITFIFQYIPLPGILMAFQDFDPFKGFSGSKWVGLENIKSIFEIPNVVGSIWNTLKISVLSLFITFPIPILLALLFNEIKQEMFKRTIQTVSYLPHFLSWISIAGMTYTLYSLNGPVNDFRVWLFGDHTERILYLTKDAFFIPNVLILNVWKETGWSSVIYLAAIAGLDVQMYEAAHIDGASRFQQMIYITLPSIMPTVVILLILRLGQIFASNFELIYALQNPFVNFEVISTVVYKSGIQQGNYSMATAIGFLQGMIALLLTFISDKLSKKMTGTSIW